MIRYLESSTTMVSYLRTFLHSQHLYTLLIRHHSLSTTSALSSVPSPQAAASLASRAPALSPPSSQVLPLALSYVLLLSLQAPARTDSRKVHPRRPSRPQRPALRCRTRPSCFHRARWKLHSPCAQVPEASAHWIELAGCLWTVRVWFGMVQPR